MPITSTLSLDPERNPANYEGAVGNLPMMRRKQLWDLADSMGIKYPQGATKDLMIEIIRGHQHVVNALDDAVTVVKQSGDKEIPLVDQVAEVFKKVKSPMDGVPLENQDDVVLRKTHIATLKKECKRRGIKFNKTDGKKVILQRLGVRDESSTDDNRVEQPVPETSGGYSDGLNGPDTDRTPT